MSSKLTYVTLHMWN